MSVENLLTAKWLTASCLMLFYFNSCPAQQEKEPSPIAITVSQEGVCILGKQCDVKVVLKNISQDRLRVRFTYGIHAGYEDYMISVKAANGRPVKRLDPFNYVNSGRIEYLQSDNKMDFAPGQSFSQDFLLGDVAKITRPGTYLVQLQRDNRGLGPSWNATSNELAIIVKAN